MSIDLTLPKPIKRAKRTFELPEAVWARFDQYVQAATVSAPHATAELVLEALLSKQLEKDRTFQRWLKETSG